MAILQLTNAVFYHPLDNLTESLKAQAWAGVGQSFGTGKVSTALTSGSAAASTPAVYATGVGATRLAFSMWSRSLGPAQFTGPPPQFFTETDRNIMTAMGIPASRLGGFT